MKVFRFYILAFLYSWGIWLLEIFFLKGTFSPELIVSIGGLGPVVGLVVYLIFSYNKRERRDYLKRLFRIREVPIYCWILVAVIPILIIVCSTIVDRMLVSNGSNIFKILVVDEEILKKGWLYVIFLLFFGPIPEEMAWRGLAFNELLKKGYFKAQIIVALLWVVWHFPLFYIEGSYQYELGLFTIDFWLFLVNLIFLSFITGWFYVNSKRSILMVIIFHYLINLTGELFYLSNQGKIIEAVITCIVAIILVRKPMLSEG